MQIPTSGPTHYNLGYSCLIRPLFIGADRESTLCNLIIYASRLCEESPIMSKAGQGKAQAYEHILTDEQCFYFSQTDIGIFASNLIIPNSKPYPRIIGELFEKLPPLLHYSSHLDGHRHPCLPRDVGDEQSRALARYPCQ